VPTPAATPAQITLTIDPARQLLRPVLQALLSHILTAVDTHLTGQPPLAELRTESVQARELRTIDYLLPGILALSIMQLGLFATAQPLVALRVQGVLKRLSATPLPRTTLLAAYIAFRLTIALFQTMLTVLIGRYAFKVAMVGSWWQFSGWVLLGTLVFLSVGFFMAAVSKNEESCIAIGNVINLPMILLSGVFFPVNHLSRFFDYLIKLVPLNYLADALRTTMVDAPPLHSAATNALVLGSWVVVMTVLAVRFFSWESR
jgi:ABC-2 type transport system permease protein